jgi:O-antigen/teichoic acid export membrane protein
VTANADDPEVQPRSDAEVAEGADGALRRSPIAADFGWSVATRALGITAGFFAAAVSARLLTRSEFGALAIATSIVAVGAVVARLGLSRVVVTVVAGALARGDLSAADGALTACVRIAAVASAIVAALLLWPVGPWLAGDLFSSPQLENVMALVAVWTAAEAIRLVVSEGFRGLHDIRAAMLLGDAGRSIAICVSLVAIAVLVGSTSLTVIVSATVAATSVIGVAAFAFLRVKVRRLPRATRIRSSGLLAIGLPLLAVELSALLVAEGDIWVVGSVRSDNEVALYSAASLVAMALAVPLYVANSVLAPRLTRLKELGRIDEMERLLRSAATYATVPSLLGFLILVAFGDTVLSVAFGSEAFGVAQPVLVILAAGVLFGVAAGSSALTLMMTGHYRIVGAVAVLVLVVTVALELIAVHYWGVEGLALASTTGTALQNVVCIVLVRQRLGVWTMATPRPAWPLPD